MSYWFVFYLHCIYLTPPPALFWNYLFELFGLLVLYFCVVFFVLYKRVVCVLYTRVVYACWTMWCIVLLLFTLFFYVVLYWTFSIHVSASLAPPLFPLNIDILFQIVPWDFSHLSLNTQFFLLAFNYARLILKGEVSNFLLSILYLAWREIASATSFDFKRRSSSLPSILLLEGNDKWVNNKCW